MDDVKKERLFILIFCLSAFLLPTIAGLILTIVFQRIVFLESFYIIFGVIVIILALARSRRRDTKNYRSTSSVQEDHKSESYREYRRLQIALYLVGLGLFGLSAISFLIGNYIFHI